VTKDWSKRVNLSILSMIIVDTYLVHKQCTGSEESPNLFFHKLAQEMIDFEQTTRLQKSAMRQADDEVERGASLGTAGRAMRQTPTKRMRPVPASSSRVSSGQKLQAKCTVCSKKTTWTCSTCREDGGIYVYVCHTMSGREGCWAEHTRIRHNVE
jgi:hypothetical protein